MQLIVYFANDGDLIQAVPVNNASPYSSPRHQADQELVPVEPQISNLSKSQHEHVNTLLGEAMKENEVAEGKMYNLFLAYLVWHENARQEFWNM